MTVREVIRTSSGQGLLILGILLIASTLRTPITSVAPMLGMIRDTNGISATEAGMLMTLPLLAFAAISPFSAGLARRYGIEKSLFGALIVVATGIALRSSGPIWALFVGTGTLGTGIAVANVLLPSLLKRDFPDRVAGLTGAYAIVSGLAQALASTAAIPLAQMPGSNWHLALAGTLIFPVAALIVWIPQLQMPAAPRQEASSMHGRGYVWRSALAWQVTGFLGLTSLVFYVIVGWLPSILAEASYPRRPPARCMGCANWQSRSPACSSVPPSSV